jgi:hypothetical protein
MAPVAGTPGTQAGRCDKLAGGSQLLNGATVTRIQFLRSRLPLSLRRAMLIASLHFGDAA